MFSMAGIRQPSGFFCVAQILSNRACHNPLFGSGQWLFAGNRIHVQSSAFRFYRHLQEKLFTPDNLSFRKPSLLFTEISPCGRNAKTFVILDQLGPTFSLANRDSKSGVPSFSRPTGLTFLKEKFFTPDNLSFRKPSLLFTEISPCGRNDKILVILDQLGLAFSVVGRDLQSREPSILRTIVLKFSAIDCAAISRSARWRDISPAVSSNAHRVVFLRFTM
jgi:hypothetical protein